MRNSTLNKAKAILNNRKYTAQLQCDQLLAQLSTIPQWVQLQKDIRRADLDISIARINQQNTKQLIAHRNTLHDNVNALLTRLQISPDRLLPQYSCPICNDSGYISGNMCSCIKDIIRSIVIGEGNISLPDATFDTSTDSNPHNCKVYNACQQLCNKIDSTQFRNVLLTGKTGTGKTHLLACMANNLALQGKDAVMLSAHALNQQLLHIHLSSVAERAEYLDNIDDIDILMIDDLGTENKYNNVTTEYLFSIVNERMLNGKHTFISTNLDLANIQERYGDRIFSRLTDKSTTLTVQLIDKDKRTQ